MKRVKKFLLSFTIFMSLFTMTIVDSSAAEAGTSMANAITMNLGQTYHKEWTRENYDTNCFNKFSTSKRGYVTINISKPYIEGKVSYYTIYVYDVNTGSLVWSCNTYPMKDDIKASFSLKLGLKAGNYVMNLEPGFYPYNETVGCDYSIKFTATDYFEIEDNDSTSKATSMNLNQIYSAVYCEEDFNSSYEDYYKINLTKGTKYRLKLGNYSALKATTTLMFLIDPSGNERAATNDYSLGYILNEHTDGTYNYYDFTAKYSGTYYIRLENCGYDVPVEYKIGVYKMNTKTNVSSLKITGVPSTKTYTGKSIKPTVTVKHGSKTLKKGTDYTVTYGTNKSTGKATIKIAGKGNYTGTVTKTFYIVPKAPTSLKLKAAKKSLKVSYKKSTGASGYQIAYSTKKNSGYKTTTTTKLSKTIGKLSAKKKYYVKVRAYKTLNGKKYYGPYTSIKNLKTK